MKECMTISVDPELEKTINDAAWRMRMSRSAFVRKLVVEGMEKLEEKEKADQAVAA
jgi:metal-responsive CopG/Arc/MetJ family transcriptional regulator